MKAGLWIRIGLLLTFPKRAKVWPDGIVVLPRPVGPDGEPIGDDMQLYMTARQLALLGWCNLPFALIPCLIGFHLFVFGFSTHKRPVNFADPLEVTETWLFALIFLLVVASTIVRLRLGSVVEGQVYVPDQDGDERGRTFAEP